MPLEKKNLDQLFAEPFPSFLEQLKTDPKAALDEFTRCAGPWLVAHPTPSMKPLTPDEQQDIVEETIKRCVAKDGEPLRNYTDMWGSFGEWLMSVAESTSAAKFGKRAPRAARPAGPPGPDPPSESPANPAKPTKPAAQPVPTAPATKNTADKPAAAEKQPTPPGSAPTREQPSGSAAKPPHRRKPPAEERPTRGMHAFYKWIKSPIVLVPLAIIVAIIVVRAFQTSGGGQSSRTATTAPIDIVMLTDKEARAPQYDLLELDKLPPAAVVDEQVSMTAVFRSGRLTVLRLATEGFPEDAYPDRIVVENEAGEIAWDSQIAPETFAEGSINLRIDPNTIVPGEYTIRILSPAGTPISRAIFAVVAQ
jgi:hypothetical protein